MLSLSQLRTNFFPIFNVLRGTGYPIEVIYKGVVYNLYIKPTRKKPVYTRPRRTVKEQIMPTVIKTEVCPECGSLMFQDVCMNTKCVQST